MSNSRSRPTVEQRILADLIVRGGKHTAGASASITKIARAIGHGNPERTRVTLQRLAATGRIILVAPSGVMTPARYRVVDTPSEAAQRPRTPQGSKGKALQLRAQTGDRENGASRP